MTVVVGTAGHIDHGKTSLLRVLTGIDADRLPEERRRGMTIDVGYAHLRLDDGTELDFVDVPGHDRLVGNMIVGAGEIDAALLVVAADDGPRAQTFEHLELLDGLGIAIGLAVVTKADAVGAERCAAVVAEVQALLARTTLAGSPVIAVSSLEGTGIDDLRRELVGVRDRVLAGRAGGARDRPTRLAIDRVFRVRGHGLVVTGTLRGGSLRRAAHLRLEPSGRPVRVRGLEVHGEPIAMAVGGGRVALNLAGLEADEFRRGDVLTSDPAVRSSDRLLAEIRPPARVGVRGREPAWPPARGAALRLHTGTTQVGATPRSGRRDRAELPDGRWVVALRLDEPIAAARGDAFVLRRPSPPGTVAGGIVLDVAPPAGPSARRMSMDRLAALVPAGGSAVVPASAALLDLHGALPATEPTADTVHAGWALAADVEAAVRAEALQAVDGAGDAGIHLAELRLSIARHLRRLVSLDRRVADAISADVVDVLVAAGALDREGDLVRAAGIKPRASSPALVAAMDRLVKALAAPAPPSLEDAARAAGCPPEGIRMLEGQGRIVRLAADIAYEVTAFEALQATAVQLATPGPLSPAALRDATGTSRKYVMALLEELDRRGVLRRTPDGHVRGPRAPR